MAKAEVDARVYEEISYRRAHPDPPRVDVLSTLIEAVDGRVTARSAAEDFEFAGERIPAGTQVLISPYVTHRLAEIWPAPERFDPDRWDPGRPGYRKPSPAEFLPFGAGPHRCIGSTLATTELQVMLSRLLERVTLTLPQQRIRPISYAAMHPRHGVKAHVDSIHPPR